MIEYFCAAFYANALQQGNELLHKAEFEQLDPMWSLQAAEEIERVLVDTGIRDHANNWIINCKITVCTVQFDTDIADYNDEIASDLLTELGFGRVIWRRRYRENTSCLILAQPNYCEM